MIQIFKTRLQLNVSQLKILLILGLLLLITKNEEWTFWLLKILLDNVVPSYHTKTMRGLRTDTAVLRELLILRVPEVNKRLEDFGIVYQKHYFN